MYINISYEYQIYITYIFQSRDIIYSILNRKFQFIHNINYISCASKEYNNISFGLITLFI